MPPPSLLLTILLPLLLLLLLSPTAQAASRGVLHIKFISYSNPSSRKSDGQYCDGFTVLGWAKRVSACDPQVNLCVGSSCKYARVSLPFIKNRDVVTFGSRIGSVSNPVSYSFASMPKSLSVSAEIKDHNRVGSADLIDRISGTVGVSTTPKDFDIRGRTSLKLRMWLTCSGHNIGSRCQLYDYCSANPCHHGTCKNKRSNYICSCDRGWKGRVCSERVDPCEGRSASVRRECRVKFKKGKMHFYAVEFSSRPVVSGLRCLIKRKRKVLEGSAAKKYCRF